MRGGGIYGGGAIIYMNCTVFRSSNIFCSRANVSQNQFSREAIAIAFVNDRLGNTVRHRTGLTGLTRGCFMAIHVTQKYVHARFISKNWFQQNNIITSTE